MIPAYFCLYKFNCYLSSTCRLDFILDLFQCGLKFYLKVRMQNQGIILSFMLFIVEGGSDFLIISPVNGDFMRKVH